VTRRSLRWKPDSSRPIRRYRLHVRLSSRWVLGVTAALLIAAVLAWLSTRNDSPKPRDEEAFLRQVNSFVAGSPIRSSQPAIAAQPDVVIDQGDQACTWLETQPAADGHEVQAAVQATLLRYLRDVTPQAGGPFTRTDLRREVALTAWRYLCDGVREDHIWQPANAEHAD
jgi:hypothetical protein